MADSIPDFTVTGHTKNPSEDFIVSWIAGASSDIKFSKEMIESSFFQVYPKHEFLMLVLRNHFLRFLLFFFFKMQSKIGVHIIHGFALYTGKYGTHSWQGE